MENNGAGMLMCDDLCMFPVELFLHAFTKAMQMI